MKIFLETDRLILRNFTQNDIDNLVELDSDPDVMRFIIRHCGYPTFKPIKQFFNPKFIRSPVG